MSQYEIDKMIGNKWRFTGITLHQCPTPPPDTRGGKFSGPTMEKVNTIRKIKSGQNLKIPSSVLRVIWDVGRSFPAASPTATGIIKERFYKEIYGIGILYPIIPRNNISFSRWKSWHRLRIKPHSNFYKDIKRKTLYYAM